MDWSAVSAIANVLVAFAVTITVVYLAIQVRDNTRATRSQTYQLATSALAEMAAIIGTDKERARIFRIGMISPEKLDQDEFVQFGYLGISLFRRFENVFFQYQSGMIDSSGSFTGPACKLGGKTASSPSASRGLFPSDALALRCP